MVKLNMVDMSAQMEDNNSSFPLDDAASRAAAMCKHNCIEANNNTKKYMCEDLFIYVVT